ncbi:MAG: HU family DNA-binding protein [Rhodospirillales bacterium]|nr:HU family DNA-binding protein [Rhodospirillales bacterium]
MPIPSAFSHFRPCQDSGEAAYRVSTAGRVAFPSRRKARRAGSKASGGANASRDVPDSARDVPPTRVSAPTTRGSSKTNNPEEEAFPQMAEKQEVVTLKAIAYELAEKHEISKKQSVEVLDGFVAALGKALKKGAKIRVPGLGIFQVRKRPARMGRNPATGEAIKIKASKKIAFRAAKDLKEAV